MSRDSAEALTPRSMEGPSQPTLVRRMSSSAAAAAHTSASLMAAGGIAGGVSKLVVAPIDRVKLIYQVGQRPFTFAAGMRTARSIVSAAGPSAMWRGNAAGMLRDIPYAAILYSSYAIFHRLVTSPACAGTDNAATRLAAGAAAGAIATSLTYPLDVMRAKLAVDRPCKRPSGIPLTYASAISQTLRTAGVGGLFAGIRPTLLGIVPYSGTSFAMFETFKAQMRRVGGVFPGPRGDGLSPLDRLVAGAVAGLCAQTFTYPLHVVRRRMQVGAGGRAVLPALWAIYSSEGVVNGLFKGLTLQMFKGPVQSAVGFTANDYAKRLLAPSSFSEHVFLRR